MLGENIDTKKAREELIESIISALKPQLDTCKPLVVAFCGESGSGKSVTAKATQKKLEQKKYSTFLLQMDDYFCAPPQQISEKRQQDLNNVGPQEVDLVLLDQHVEAIKKGQRDFELREMHFSENKLYTNPNNIPKGLDVLIVEGTYTCMLKNVDRRVFLERTYKQTHIHRAARMREPQTELIEKVLEVEHQIVCQLIDAADLIINDHFQLRTSK